MIYDEINPIPELPQQIIDAVNNKNLAIFIGAGVSRIVGCASWKELANNLIESCYLHSFISSEEKETLREYDPKKIITICHHILKQNKLEAEFFEIIKEALEPDVELESSYKIYEELYGLRGLFITTNVDDRFLNRFYSIACKKEDFKLKEDENKIDISRLYHIHGSILDLDTLVFTVPQYLEKYNDEYIQIFMRELFSKYVILFVGYGLEEFEILDYLITKFDTSKGQEIKHFTLRPYFKNENRILEFDQFYYSSLGIKVLPYQKDVNGYSQLYEVLKRWNSEINQISAYLYTSFHEIDEVIANFDETSADRIFQLIRNDKPQENYFFETLASCGNPLPWLKPLLKRGYFDPKKNPLPKKISNKDRFYFEIKYWNVLGCLKNLAEKNVPNQNIEVAKTLSQIIDLIFEYCSEDGTKIRNYHTDSILINVIFKLPTEMIEEKHIGYIESALDSEINKMFITSQIAEVVLPFLISNKKKDLLLKLLSVIFKYQKSGDAYKYSSTIEDHWLDESILKYKKEIAKLCGIEAANIVIHKMEDIISEDDTRFGIFPIVTIEQSDENLIEENYAYQFVSFVRDIFENIDPELLKLTILEMLSKSHPIFKRIAIHTINYHYDVLKERFWEWDTNPLNEYSLKHEIYRLFDDNCLSFSNSQLETVINWIESAGYNVDDLPIDYKDKYLAYRKKCWLTSILKTKDSRVVPLYNKYNEINPKQVRPEGENFVIESFSGNVTPIEEFRLIEKSNDEIAKYLREFKEEVGIRNPSKEGLAETLRKCVLDEPNKFAEHMTPFSDVPEIYQHSIFWGLTEAWKNKRSFSWGSVLSFTLHFIKSTEFWDNKQIEGEHNYKDWIISQISDLINEGLLSENTLENDLFPLAEEILLILVQGTSSHLNDKGDITISVLNSSKGKIFSALINYSMRFSQLNSESKEKRWKDSIKLDFNKRLNRDVEPSLEYSYTLGKYISYLFYLDENWTRENINKIFPIDQDKHWEAAFTGYLYYCSIIDKRIYCLLRENGHYKKGINIKFEDGHINEKLVKHICIAYIEGLEKLDDNKSLIYQILENSNARQISAIVQYFKTQKGKLTEETKSKIKPLWKSLYEVLSSNEEDTDYQVVASSLCSWVSLIDCIDEDTLEWLKFSVRNIDSIPYFIEDLVMHAQNTPLEVGKIYLEMLKHDKYFYYKEEKTQEIIRILYEKDQKNIANRICVCFESKGYRFLREIYKEYNHSK